MKDRWDEDRKLLIKGRNQSFTRFKVQGSGFKVQGSGFKVQGSRFRVEVAASPPFFIGAMPSRFVLAVGFHPCFSSFFIHCCIQ